MSTYSHVMAVLGMVSDARISSDGLDDQGPVHVNQNPKLAPLTFPCKLTALSKCVTHKSRPVMSPLVDLLKSDVLVLTNVKAAGHIREFNCSYKWSLFI